MTPRSCLTRYDDHLDNMHLQNGQRALLFNMCMHPPVLKMLAEDAEAGAEDEKEVEELKKQGINPLPKPPPGVGLLPTPPRPIPVEATTAPGDFGGPGGNDFGSGPGPNQCPMPNKGPLGPGPVPGPPPCAGFPGPVPGPGPCPGPGPGPGPGPEGNPFQGPPPNTSGPPPHMGPPPPMAGGGGGAGKKIPSLFEIKVQPTGQLAQKLAVR